MASSLGGGDGGDPGDNFNLPKTPRLIQVDRRASGVPSQESEENVIRETDGIFRHFVHSMLERERSNERTEVAPRLAEVDAFLDESPNAPAVRVGRQLAIIGDTLNTQHAQEFDYHIGRMNLSSENAYEAFANIARKVFKDGVVNWGRIVTLLCFGYRLAVNVLRRGISGFFSNIVTFIIKFVVSERIASWIAEQGGWLAALSFAPENVGWGTLALIAGAAALCVATAIYINKKQ